MRGRWLLVGLLGHVLCLFNPECEQLFWRQYDCTTQEPNMSGTDLTDTKALGFSSNCRRRPRTKGKELHGTSWQKERGLIFFLWRDYWACGAGELDLPHTGWKNELRINFQLWLLYTFEYTIKSQPQKETAPDSLVRHEVWRLPTFLKNESCTKIAKKKKKIIFTNQSLTWDYFEIKASKAEFCLQSEWNLLTTAIH